MHPSSAESNKGSNRIRILVVDDERMIADSLAAILRLSGYESQVAYNGLQALTAIAAFHPQLIISDIVMPELDGIGLLVEIRNSQDPPLMMLMSGNAEAAGMLKKFKISGEDVQFVTKPIPIPDMLSLVKTAVSRIAA
jgi:DNA-binding response OmpR family regulator